MEIYTGKICPFCKTPIQGGDAVTVCPACGIPHHASCWNENHGCTTFGCSEQHYQAQHTNPTDVCSNCFAPLGDGQAFCPQCGTPRSVAKKNVCDKCGAELADGQVFCGKCGQKVGMAVEPTVNSAISQFNAGVEQKKKKGKAKVFLLIAIAAIVAVALFLFLKGPSVEQITLSKSSLELREDDHQTVSYTIYPEKAADVEVTWSSSDEKVATVSSNGRITAKGEGFCVITVTAGGKTDSISVTVTSGPDLAALYHQYCESKWAEYGSDGSYLNVDTNPYNWDDSGLAYPAAYTAIKNINTALGLPASVTNDMGETTGADGRQTQTFDDIGVTVSWRYHPDKGLEVTYKLTN